jgi:ABC-2 type transport system permease protein
MAVIKKEFIQISRDRLTIGMIVMLPMVQLILFGYGIQTEVKHISTAVFDQSMTEESRDVIDAFRNTGYFNINYAATSYDEMTRLIASGHAQVGIIFPPDFLRDLKQGEPAQIQVNVDASDNMTANQAIAAATSIGEIKSLKVLIKKYNIANSQPYDVEVRPWYNPDGIAAYYMVPALLGIIVTMTMTQMTAIAITRERERGTLEQLLVTPIRPYELMIGKVVPNIVLGYVQITIALIVAFLLFGVPMRGSLLLLYLLTMFFITASLGLGIMISNITKNQMQAMQMSFMVMLPSIILSGFLFPRAAMPKIIYYISSVIPMTYYLQIIRGIMLKGVGFSYLIGQVIALLVFSVIFLAVASVNFKKKIA